MSRRNVTRPPAKSPSEAATSTDLRIIGGTFRGRKLLYHGDPLVRPMKHRVREAIFNLIGTEAQGRHAIDLFAGTGALGLEALSRGAVSATFIERHVPTSKLIEQNFTSLDVVEQTTLLVTSAFLWSKRDLPDDSAGPPRDVPWLVFCSPPYDFFVDQCQQMLDLVGRMVDHAPAGSVVVVEADERFDFALLPEEGWDVRCYPPAVVGIWRG